MQYMVRYMDLGMRTTLGIKKQEPISRQQEMIFTTNSMSIQLHGSLIELSGL